MPVELHPVHESVRHGTDKRYGCHNKPRARDSLLVKNGHAMAAPDGLETVQQWKVVPDFGSLECRYDMSLTDPWCEGCEHRGSGERYDQMIRANGA